MTSRIHPFITVFGLILGLFLAFATFTDTTSACSRRDCFPPVQGSCYASVSRAETGETITWRTSVSGGNGYYSYAWSGTDGLSGNYPTASKSYSSEGTKNATVQITSYGETITRTCSVVIEEEPEYYEDLDGYCEAVSPSDPEVGDTVTWRAYPEGGDGDYDYDWSGSESLDGDERTVYKDYDNDGNKTATVRITSDGQSITRSCSVNIDEEEDEDEDEDLDAYCKASPSTGEEGDRIKWTVYPEGGDGDYDYDWDGDDGLSGDDKTIYHTYDREGNYDAEVEVESDGERVTARCDVDIEEEDDDRDYDDDDDNGIYLSSIPATGISLGMKTGLFATGIVLWSAFLGYLYVARRNEKKREQEILNSVK